MEKLLPATEGSTVAVESGLGSSVTGKYALLPQYIIVLRSADSTPIAKPVYNNAMVDASVIVDILGAVFNFCLVIVVIMIWKSTNGNNRVKRAGKQSYLTDDMMDEINEIVERMDARIYMRCKRYIDGKVGGDGNSSLEQIVRSVQDNSSPAQSGPKDIVQVAFDNLKRMHEGG